MPRRVYNETLTRKLFLAHKGVRPHDATMAQNAGVGACSAVTDGDDMSEGEWKFWF